MSQNITLSAVDKLDIAKIKLLLLDNKNQQQIAHTLGKRRETINRKIARWMQTEDFKTWANTLWLEHYTEVRAEDTKEALRALTKLLAAKETKHIESEHREVNIDIKRVEMVELIEGYDEAVKAAIRRNIQSATKDTLQ